MQVLYDEGKANHIGPEPCIALREERGEASAGESAGRPLSPERSSNWVLTCFSLWKATRQREGTLTLCRPSGVVEPGTHGNALRGNREISRWTTGCKAVWSATGRRGAVAADE